MENKQIEEINEKINKRVDKNIAQLKEEGIPYYKDLKNIPTEFNTRLKDKKSLFKLLISKYLIATMATTFSSQMDIEYYNFIYRNMDIQYRLDEILTEQDKKILDAIKSQQDINTAKLSWLYEECAILLWVLGISDFPSQRTTTNVNNMNDLLFMTMGEQCNKPSILYTKLYNPDKKSIVLDNLNLISIEEILEKADLLARYKWAIEEEYVQKTSFNMNLNRSVVYSQNNVMFEILAK